MYYHLVVVNMISHSIIQGDAMYNDIQRCIIMQKHIFVKQYNCVLKNVVSHAIYIYRMICHMLIEFDST